MCVDKYVYIAIITFEWANFGAFSKQFTGKVTEPM